MTRRDTVQSLLIGNTLTRPYQGLHDTGELLEAILYILKRKRDFSYAAVARKYSKRGTIAPSQLMAWVWSSRQVLERKDN